MRTCVVLTTHSGKQLMNLALVSLLYPEWLINLSLRLTNEFEFPKVRSKRKTRCRLLLNRFTAEKVKNIIFTDEKDFTLEVTGFMVNGKETLLQTDYITKRADLPNR